jgi:hypothetical protein
MASRTKSTATPFYALAGFGDLAVAKVREVGDELASRFATLDQQALQAELTKRVDALAADARTVPAKLRELPIAAQASIATVLSQADETYEVLAGRGKQVVTRIRNQKATQDLVAQASTTVSKAKATRTSVRKTAATASQNAKATTTSARKTAKTASKAAGDGANKVGN